MDDVIREIKDKWERHSGGPTFGLTPSERMRLVRARKATDARILGRSCESLIGICAGELADGVFNDEEIRFLDLWLDDHSQIAETWPGEVIYARVKEILRDGVISEEERAYLKETLSQLIGGTLQETGGSFPGPSKLPVDRSAVVEIQSRLFCFTGNFLYGTRSACVRAVTVRGGIAQERVSMDLDYLVVGTMTSEDWIHSTFGRKIEKAVEFRDRGRKVRIVGENQWVAALG